MRAILDMFKIPIGGIAMFIVKWRNRAKTMVVTVGLSRYSNRVSAEKQIALWTQYFPANTYYIE